MTPRNIIFFHSESWDGRMIGPLGHPALQSATPAVDRLARDGVLFENAYCTHPICCPSRANMWSGRYTQACEAWNNYKGLESNMWALLDVLPKTHTVKTLGKLDYRSGGHTIMARLTAWLGASGIERPEYDEDESQSFSVSDDDSPRCHERDWRLVDQAVAFLEEQAAGRQGGGDDKPFFLYISPGLVHAAFHTNRYWLDRIPEEDVDIPPLDPTEHPCRLFQRMAKAWRFGFDDDTVRKMRRVYMAMCAEADATMGAVYDAMQRLGLAEDTYFVFSSDHGELALEHQDWYKMSFYEGSVRVPLAMAGPGIQAGARKANLVSLIDMCPTLIEMAGLAIDRPLDGESLLPLATGRSESSRDSAYACFMGTSLNTSGYMLRKGRWKYVVYVGYPSQLFDMEADPQELHDLAAERPDVVAAMDAELRTIVDIEATHQAVMAYNKEEFRQFRRQARQGMYVDDSYGLRDCPSSDYWAIMDNSFTGYDESDEAVVDAWLNA